MTARLLATMAAGGIVGGSSASVVTTLWIDGHHALALVTAGIGVLAIVGVAGTSDFSSSD